MKLLVKTVPSHIAVLNNEIMFTRPIDDVGLFFYVSIAIYTFPDLSLSKI